MKDPTVDNFQWVHERHRIFPAVFENRNHKKIIDISAGIGVVADRISENYDCELHCNEIDTNCLAELEKLNVTTVSFDIDSGEPFPLSDGFYDAVLCFDNLEHLQHIDFFITELHRILNDTGRLYLSITNYASLYWLIPILKGKTFHDPFGERSRFEFYGNSKYFTYHSLVYFMEHFGFFVDSVYLTLPRGSIKFNKIRKRSKSIAFLIQNFFRMLYSLSPRWHHEPVVCFQKSDNQGDIKKVIL